MKRLLLVLGILIFLSTYGYTSVNYTSFVDFFKSDHMKFFILGVDESNISVYIDQQIASYLTKFNLSVNHIISAEYVPDVHVLRNQLSKEFNQANSNSSIPNMYVITQKHFLSRASSGVGTSNVIDQEFSLEIRRVNNFTNFDYNYAPIVAYAELYEKDEFTVLGIDEMLVKVLKDIFDRMR